MKNMSASKWYHPIALANVDFPEPGNPRIINNFFIFLNMFF